MKSGKIMVLLTVVLAVTRAGANEGVVTADVLKVRTTADTKAATVHTLKRGTIVRILSESPTTMKVDGLEAPWLQIEAEGKQGWSFGGFIATNFKRLSADHLAWSVQPAGAPYDSGLTIVLYDTKSGKESKTTSSLETADYQFSENLRYLATDEGTDVSGGIRIIDLQNKGKVLAESSYMPRGLKWKGNALTFDKIICFDDGFAITEEIQFDNGKVRKTGQYAKTDFHVGVETGGCKKYMRLLPK